MDVGDDLVAVGRIGPAHGTRGDVFVLPWTDNPDLRFAPGTVLRTDRPQPSALTVDSSRLHSGRLVIRFEGVGDLQQATALRGVQLLVSAADRPTLTDPDEFYDTDLVGLAAVTVVGVALGTVREVVHAPAGDYLLLDVDGRERMVPFVSHIVPTVDVAAGRVVVDPPEGLLEL